MPLAAIMVCMSPLAHLRAELRRSRAAMLSAVAGLPEAALYRPGASGPWSVAQLMAQRIEAENRALTLVQSMLHGHPSQPDLPQEELDRLAVLRRREWEWPHLMRELYQQREETNWNLDDLTGAAVNAAPVDVNGKNLTPLGVLKSVADQELALAERLRAWRAGLEAQSEIVA